MGTFTVVGACVEVDFFDDHIEFSASKGYEGVESNPELLFCLIREHWGDDRQA